MKVNLSLLLAILLACSIEGCAESVVNRQTVAAEDLPLFDYLSKQTPGGLDQDTWQYARWYYHATKDLSPAERARFSARENRRLDAAIDRELYAGDRLGSNDSSNTRYRDPSLQPGLAAHPSYTITPYGYGTTIRGSDGSVTTCTQVGKDQICR